jgi:uncharacterized membrane protein YqaE (UPF0057 family)
MPFKVIPRSEWKDRIAEGHAKKTFPIYHQPRKKVPILSQKSLPYCWMYAVTGAVQSVRACAGLRLIIAIFLPPLAVFLQVGLSVHFWNSICLTLLGVLRDKSYQPEVRVQIAGVRIVGDRGVCVMDLLQNLGGGRAIQLGRPSILAAYRKAQD